MVWYTLTSVENLIAKYREHDGEVYILEEWVLWLGLVVCTWERLKNCVIKEKYLNEWSSIHTIRFYRILPKKYADLIDNL